MSTPQQGIFVEGTPTHQHLELVLHDDATDSEVRSAIASLLDVADAAMERDGAHLVIGVGPALWLRLAGGGAPQALRPFAPVGTAEHGAPSTQRDLWVWVHGPATDVVFDAARAAAGALGPVADVALDQPAWIYRDMRDLTGFQDGTENPGRDEAHGVALIDDALPGGGGSHAITMRWVHDLAAWESMTVAAQECVIGRTKPDSVELADEVRPDTAHISRVVVEEDGEELEIYRRSIPYGSVAEHGLYFVAFSADPHRFERMLARMYGVEDGISDRLTEFSTPVSGSAWFVPSLEDLTEAAGAGQ